MKRIFKILLLILTFSSCEEVIDVDLDTAPPRLVVEASINWIKETNGRNQQITLTQTAPYFEDDVPPATGASVFLEDESGNRFDFAENGTTGIYENNDFNPEINRMYTLTIVYQGETYRAEEGMMPVTDLNYVTQNNGEVFGESYIEIKAYFDDPVADENYYFYKFEAKNDHNIDVLEDRLVNGNEMFAFFVSEDIEVDEDVEISLYGISKQYYNYMHTLLSQTGENGGPFETQPATVRGNIINTTNPDNFAFGYFRLSETDTYTYTIE